MATTRKSASIEIPARSRFSRGAKVLGLNGTGRQFSDSGDGALIESMTAELTLLREENSRLKIERSRQLDSVGITARLRAEFTTGHPEDIDDEAFRALAEALAFCGALVEATHNMDAAMAALRGRLAMLAPLAGAPQDPEDALDDLGAYITQPEDNVVELATADHRLTEGH